MFFCCRKKYYFFANVMKIMTIFANSCFYYNLFKGGDKNAYVVFRVLRCTS